MGSSGMFIENALQQKYHFLIVSLVLWLPECCNGGFPPCGVDEDETVYKFFPEIRKFNPVEIIKNWTIFPREDREELPSSFIEFAK